MEIDYLEKGDAAPFPGYLLTDRVMVLLYQDAEEQLTEETLKELRERYEESHQ